VNTSYPASNSYDKRTVVLDPGHGGKDGGALSLTGAKEKDLNLELSLILGVVLNILGYDVIFTRQSDVELTHPDGGSRKMQDLKGRLEFLLNYADSPFISIHMNKFPIEKYSGAQIYYTVNNDNALPLAQSISKVITDNIQPSNKRAVKPSTSAIYLLHKAKSPAVLIECGFLSNHEEANLLQDDIYKAKIASAIAYGINIWYNGYAVNKG
jgi:N-acetylmuramoyl-L-alanine amidase